jgi:hypothetical protein
MSDKFVRIASGVLKKMADDPYASAWDLIDVVAAEQGHSLARSQKCFVRDVIAESVRRLSFLELAEA